MLRILQDMDAYSTPGERLSDSFRTSQLLKTLRARAREIDNLPLKMLESMKRHDVGQAGLLHPVLLCVSRLCFLSNRTL